MKTKAAVLFVLSMAAAPAVPRAETPLERGTYLMKSIVACGACHTNPAPGSSELAGGQRFSDIAFTAHAANLTPDPETGIGAWTDEQVIAGFREGRRPRGSTIGPPMPISMYRGVSDEDARAIVAYLRALKPVMNKVPRSTYRIPAPDYGPPVGPVASVPSYDPVKYGAYLATALGHCMECHSRRGEGGAPDLASGLGAGGAEFHGPWGVSLAPNITPSGIGHYSDDELRKIITTGFRPDGSKLNPPMPVAYYANMRDADVAAIIAYLRSLPKK